VGNVYVYEADATDFACVGLVGALTPTECRHEEVGNGASELTLVHPVDDWGRYAALLPDRILRAPIPVRTCPEISEGTIVTTFEVWTVLSTATKGQRYVYSKKSGGSKKKLLKAGTRVLVTWKDEAVGRYKIRYGGRITDGTAGLPTMKGGTSGWISKAALYFETTETAPATPAGIEALEPAWRVRDQLFRITEVKKSESGKSVTVTALRLFYDLRGNLTNYKNTGTVQALAALAAIKTNLSVATDFDFYTDIVGTRTGIDWARMNPVRALLDDDAGFCALWGAQLVRDDWDVYLLSEAGMDRGVRIEYAKNLTGVDCVENVEDVITRIIPVGQTKKGGELLLDGDIWVDSEHIAEYASPHINFLKCDNAKVSDSVSTALARARMREKAQAMFTDGCDLPKISVSIDFVNLGDTEEYAQYRALEGVFLFDTVHVHHPKLGIDVQAEVVRHVWDCLNERVLEVELGSATGNLTTAASAEAMVEARLAEMQANVLDILPYADLSKNTTISSAVLAVSVESSAGSVLKSQSTTTGATLTARVYRGGVEITDTVDASLFSWSRESGNSTSDDAWKAAHAGVKAVTVTAAEFASAPAVYYCDVADAAEEV
jgi:phage minor structural protein